MSCWTSFLVTRDDLRISTLACLKWAAAELAELTQAACLIHSLFPISDMPFRTGGGLTLRQRLWFSLVDLEGRDEHNIDSVTTWRL